MASDRKHPPHAPHPPAAAPQHSPSIHRAHVRPEDLFRAEKERSRSSARSLHAKLLAEAKAAFDKLMAEGQAARKSGRPRKHPLPPLKTGSALRQPPVQFFRATPAAATPPKPVVSAQAAKATGTAPATAPGRGKSAKRKATRPKAKRAKARARPKARSGAKARSRSKKRR